MKKKVTMSLLLAAMSLSLLAGCGGNTVGNANNAADSTTKDTSAEDISADGNAGTNASATDNTDTADNTDTVDTGFTLEYPTDMQALGFTDPLVLEETPERVVSLSAAPVLALYELGVNLVGVPNSMVVTWPEELTQNAETVSFSIMSADTFDAETVVTLDPDLVLLAYNAKDTAGATLESAGLAVYYLSAGHTVSYESIKAQTQVFIDAFGKDDDAKQAGEDILNRFADLESRMEAAQEALAGKTVMVLQSGSDSHYIQTADGTLGSMADKIGLKNVYENDSSSMVQLDFEQALDYDPDLVLCVGGTGAEEHQEMMEAAFAANEDYWYSIDAIQNGQVIYLPVAYCSTAGINVIDQINELMDTVKDFYGLDF